jgi:hypothetical protein
MDERRERGHVSVVKTNTIRGINVVRINYST